MNLGYTKNLFILPFDHRASFAKMLGFDEKNLLEDQKNTISSNKEIIYEAFKKSLLRIPKEQAAILVDEEYGDTILRDANDQNYNIILTTEKSGQETFDFEYGEKFAKHIEKYKPNFVKALIRYHPNADWNNLKTLSDYCHEHGYKFLLEVLSGLSVSSSKNIIPTIMDLREKGIEPDVWKIEGMETSEDYQKVVEKAQEAERKDVGIVILGRAENQEKVEQWIKAGSKVDGVRGFAVGRTVFWNPLIEYKDGKITKEQAVQKISDNFLHFYNIFTNKL